MLSLGGYCEVMAAAVLAVHSPEVLEADGTVGVLWSSFFVILRAKKIQFLLYPFIQ